MFNRDTRKPVRGDYDRLWLSADYFDLIVWYASDDSIHGFQLCYGKPTEEHAFTWTSGKGFSHRWVDDGESGGLGGWRNQTPILLPDGAFSSEPVADEFRRRSVDLPAGLRDLVLGKISEYARLHNT